MHIHMYKGRSRVRRGGNTGRRGGSKVRRGASRGRRGGVWVGGEE